MSISGGVLVQSPEPEARDKVLYNKPDRIGIWKCWFLRRGENRSSRRKTFRSKDENQQQTQPTYDVESGDRTRATVVEASTLTTASSDIRMIELYDVKIQTSWLGCSKAG